MKEKRIRGCILIFFVLVVSSIGLFLLKEWIMALLCMGCALFEARFIKRKLDEYKENEICQE